MSQCSACGGDGLIEIGAYRGDDGPDGRPCALCGGKISPQVESVKEQYSGSRRVVTLADSNQMSGEQIENELRLKGIRLWRG